MNNTDGQELREGILQRIKARLKTAAGQIVEDETGRALEGTINFLEKAKKRLAEIQALRKRN